MDSDVKLFSEKLEAVQIRRKSLTAGSSEAKQEQYRVKQVERFVGSLESSLSFYERLGQDSELAAEVSRLRERVQILREEVSTANIAARKRRRRVPLVARGAQGRARGPSTPMSSALAPVCLPDPAAGARSVPRATLVARKLEDKGPSAPTRPTRTQGCLIAGSFEIGLDRCFGPLA